MAGNTIKFLIEMRDSASGPLKKVGKAADQSAKDAKNATTRYTELSSKLHLLGVAAGAAKAAVNAVAKPMMLLAKGGIEAGAQMEGFETRLNVLMGSSAAAKQRLDELFKIGSTTPFELPGLIEAEVNLRALGVNAEETLPLVMDFAGAMGIDVARAGVEVGRAMQFGAGAVETIAGRALRAQVELRTGADALKMSTGEFRQAMVETLTDPDGIFKGGTEKLAATFDGMLSNLQDAFFKFKKDIGDAGLFDTAKETLRAMLEFIDQNADGLRIMSRVISDGVVRGLLGSVKLAGFLFDSFLAIGAAIMDIARKWTEMVISVGDVASKIGLGPSKEEQKALEDRLSTLIDSKEELIEMGGFATMAEDMVSKIQTRVANLPKGRSGGGGGGGRPPPDTAATAADAPEKGKKLPTAEEMEKAMLASLEGTEASLLQSLESLQDLQYKLSPAGLAEGMVNKLSDSFGTMTAMMGPAGGLVSGLSELGKSGAKPIIKALKESIKGLIVGLVEVLPALIVEIPRILIDAIPDLIEGILSAIPALLEALFIGLPTAIFQGLVRWFTIAWETIKGAFGGGLFKKGEEGREKRTKLLLNVAKTLADAFGGGLFKGSKQTGAAHIDKTGLALVHAGEAILPSNGANAQSVAGRMGRGGGVNVHISTNVVDTNAIRGLGKLLEREFGSFGRSTSPVFSSPTGTSG